MKSLDLGASLYVPATRSDLIEIACHRKIGNLRSVIFCLEDAVRSDEFELALDNLARLCQVLDEASMLRFVRVRNPNVLRLLLDLPGSSRSRVCPSETDTGVIPRVSAGDSTGFLTVPDADAGDR